MVVSKHGRQRVLIQPMAGAAGWPGILSLHMHSLLPALQAQRHGASDHADHADHADQADQADQAAMPVLVYTSCVAQAAPVRQHSAPPAPLLAMTGMVTALLTLSTSSMSKPWPTPSLSMQLRRISPAPSACSRAGLRHQHQVAAIQL